MGPQTLGVNEQSLTSYKYDCFAGAQVSVFVDNIWVDDVVSIQFTVTEPKSPIYGYASRFYDLAASGNRIIQGQLAIAYTEEGYLTTILNQRRKNLYGSDSVIDRTTTSGSPLATMSEVGGPTDLWKTADGGLDNTKLQQVGAERKRLLGLAEGARPADYTTQLKRIEEEYARLIQISLGKQPATQSYTRSTIRDLLGDERGLSNYEDLAELMEDAQLDPTKLKALKEGVKWSVVRGYKGEYRLRKALEFDLEEGRTKESVPFNYIGDGFDMIIMYGDFSIGSAEHTLKVLSDVHFTSEGQVVEANGNPIIEVYTFFARDIGDTSHLYNPKTGLANSTNVGGNASGKPAESSELVTMVVLEAYNKLASGAPGQKVLELEYPVRMATPSVSLSPVVKLDSSLPQLAYTADSYESDVEDITFEKISFSTAYRAAKSTHDSIVIPTAGLMRIIKATNGRTEKIMLSDRTLAARTITKFRVVVSYTGGITNEETLENDTQSRDKQITFNNYLDTYLWGDVKDYMKGIRNSQPLKPYTITVYALWKDGADAYGSEQEKQIYSKTYT